MWRTMEIRGARRLHDSRDTEDGMREHRTSIGSPDARETSGAHAPDVSPTIGRALTLVMAAACGTCVANIYYNQPLLALLEKCLLKLSFLDLSELLLLRPLL